MSSLLVKNARIVNEGKEYLGDVFVKNGLFYRIGPEIKEIADQTIDAGGKWLFPGVIDDQVHFREPGLTHKADIRSESRAAVAGGITSFMEMPNTQPQTLNQELLEAKYAIAAANSYANYSFFMGASNDNLAEVLKTNPLNVCGIKVFMGSSTGNMLVDKEQALEGIFRESRMLVATHCEKEEIIKANLENAIARYGEDIPIEMHPLIRSVEACYASSSQAVALAKKYGTRLHILHISTEKELELFDSNIPLAEKKITAEVCVHHLRFNSDQYAEKGMLIKWNPAVKNKSDQDALLAGLISNKLDIVATDHAPHTLEEKQRKYLQAPSGGPLVQHALVAMLEFYHEGKLSLSQIINKMCHAPAICFQLSKRGFVREGYHADFVLVDANNPWKVDYENILYKCRWSPFEGTRFRSKVTHTFINGQMVYAEGKFDDTVRGKRLLFDRK